jgi:hypothetical protein
VYGFSQIDCFNVSSLAENLYLTVGITVDILGVLRDVEVIVFNMLLEE